MSASEKLRSLATAWRTGEYDMVTVKPTTVLDALPQLVAVVEAAERAQRYMEKSSYLVGADAVNEAVSDALAALDEALT